VNGTLYGTTRRGGTSDAGTVYELTGSTDNVLHSFAGGTADGADPFSDLANVSGTLYGTTCCGGTHNGGTVFSVTTTGTERVLHNFGKGIDGNSPEAGLLDIGGTLWGTTVIGGLYGCGTLYSITTGGNEKVQWNFGYYKDGCNPYGRLAVVNNVAYGTTWDGGAYGYGTVFSVSASGENVLYSFGKPGDGRNPSGALIGVGGKLYGTTNAGGSKCPKIGGCGTVFSLTPSGNENVLHSFSSGAVDGKYPQSDLINVGGTLYGTTAEGGQYHSYGTIFSITTGGSEKLLHSFGLGHDGRTPLSALIYKNGYLVSTTLGGGVYADGTVFSFMP
jgi:uncharacterized repeat protein (TIGR03803 family)